MRKKKDKRACCQVDFAVTADYRVKIKESEKRDKYLDLARVPRKLWNVWIVVILILIDTFGTIPKGLERVLIELEIGSRIETIQTTALLRSARILRRVLDT